MRDVTIEIEVGKELIGILVYQGSRSPHQRNGVRILHRSYVQLARAGDDRNVYECIAQAGYHLAATLGSYALLAKDHPQLPID